MNKIVIIRGEKVMLDKDLAELYGVTTGNLNLAVRRNTTRFPNDFMFQISKEEFQNLILQSATSSWGGTRKLPYAFTEQGVAMLSGILKSERAIEVNIAIMRTFVQLRKLMSSNDELAKKINDMEKKYDEQFHVIFEAIKQLIVEENKPRKAIGFRK